MISIVDDDVCARKATEGIIRSLGYAVATYASAEDFLGSDHVNDTSCLITDVHLPGLTGVELYRRLLDDGFAAPTIFVSGLADETTRTEALAAGAIGFLSKPSSGAH
jgi:FixJ family two-component response regulator